MIHEVDDARRSLIECEAVDCTDVEIAFDVPYARAFTPVLREREFGPYLAKASTG